MSSKAGHTGQWQYYLTSAATPIAARREEEEPVQQLFVKDAGQPFLSRPKVHNTL
jgi:hypothetical protein